MFVYKVVVLSNEVAYTYPSVYTRGQITNEKLGRYISDTQLIFGPHVPDNEIDVMHLLVCDSETHEVFQENLSPFIYWPILTSNEYAKRYKEIRGKSVHDYSTVY